MNQARGWWLYWVSAVVWVLGDATGARGHHSNAGSGDPWSFGSRLEESEGPWIFLIASVLLLALFGIVWFLIRQVQRYRREQRDGENGIRPRALTPTQNREEERGFYKP
jgi:hypothetical protein